MQSNYAQKYLETECGILDTTSVSNKIYVLFGDCTLGIYLTSICPG